MNNQKYTKFLESKMIIAPVGEEMIKDIIIPELAYPHQKDICSWSLKGERRAIFAAFGLGKTLMQLVIAQNVIMNTNKPFLIVCPLAVQGEFRKDAELLGYDVPDYITHSDNAISNKIYLTNYERIRKGDFDANMFGGVSFDEASILRNLNTQTVEYVLSNFKSIPFRFVATATPTPNNYIEILNYADYLGVIDRGQALTRFFQRDSKKAGNLKLYPHKEDEFWLWVSTWAMFISKPSDLGYSDKGYALSELNVIERHISNIDRGLIVDRDKNIKIFTDVTKSLVDASREKRNTINERVDETIKIMKENPNKNFILWHDLEDERKELEKAITREFGKESYLSVYGSQTLDQKERNLISFSKGEVRYLITKSKIAGSGCNFQYHCHNMIFVTINYKFNDFIQAIHRCYRFKQQNDVNIFIVFTDAQEEILKALYNKWTNHNNLQNKMTDIVKQYGLNQKNVKANMKRNIGIERLEYNSDKFRIYNNDTVLETANMPDNSKHFIITSIPFGDHYEYSESYNDMGHNFGNGEFFKQMDYLTPELLRVLKPGRVAAIHVKDRIRYSYQNGAGMTTIDDFSGETVRHFQKHGFWLIGKITITTDVVRENNQTYRLGWSEQCKDGSKMGVGLPEYVLLFRKAPTDKSNAYADERCERTKEEYTKAQWQLDAHAYWKSSGDRFLRGDELRSFSIKRIRKIWENLNGKEVYNFFKHLNTSKDMDDMRKLSSTFMTLAPISNSGAVWTDVNRLHTLNTKQTNKKKEKHICPLQFDIVNRLIDRYSAEGEVVYDPFGGLMTVPYCAVKKGRIGEASELNHQYFIDGLAYMKALEYQLRTPTLFDLVA